MKRPSRTLAGAISGFVMIAALSACSSSGTAADGESTVKIQLSIPDPIASSVGVTAQHFADQVKSKSDGK